MTADVVIVGGGVIGCACAYLLAREGVAVTVLEKDRVGAHASGGAAGILSAEDEGSGHDAFQALARLGLERHSECAPWLREETGIDVEFQRHGILTVVSEEAVESARSLAGAGHRWLDPREVRDLEPALRGGFGGGIFAPGDGQVNTPRLTAALAEAASRHGARFKEGVTVTALLTDGNRATGVRTNEGDVSGGNVVLAAGPWSGLLASALGTELPVFPVKGQILWVRTRPVALSRPVYALGVYLVPKYEMGIAVGATEEDAGFDERPTLAAAVSLGRKAAEVCPALSGAEFLRLWASVRPGSGDGLPILGPVPGFDGLIAATGHFRNGILLSLISGELVRNWILNSEQPLDVSPFSPDRFSTP